MLLSLINSFRVTTWWTATHRSTAVRLESLGLPNADTALHSFFSTDNTTTCTYELVAIYVHGRLCCIITILDISQIRSPPRKPTWINRAVRKYYRYLLYTNLPNDHVFCSRKQHCRRRNGAFCKCFVRGELEKFVNGEHGAGAIQCWSNFAESTYVSICPLKAAFKKGSKKFLSRCYDAGLEEGVAGRGLCKI